jgi:hypothetical protein
MKNASIKSLEKIGTHCKSRQDEANFNVVFEKTIPENKSFETTLHRSFISEIKDASF